MDHACPLFFREGFIIFGGFTFSCTSYGEVWLLWTEWCAWPFDSSADVHVYTDREKQSWTIKPHKLEGERVWSLPSQCLRGSLWLPLACLTASLLPLAPYNGTSFAQDKGSRDLTPLCFSLVYWSSIENFCFTPNLTRNPFASNIFILPI